MLDLPPQAIDHPKTEIEQIVAQAHPKKKGKPVYFSARDASAIEDPLYQKAQAMVATMNDGFQWSDLITIIQEAFDFIKSNQGLAPIEQKQQVAILLNHIVDLTDTPYLPDSFTDPLFKLLIPPVIDVVINSGKFSVIPVIRKDLPTQDTFKRFAQELQNTYADGFQWSDLGSYIQSSMNFVCSFAVLTSAQKQTAVVDIINMVIDTVDFPYVPDDLIDPILKTLVPPMVSMVFARLGL